MEDIFDGEYRLNVGIWVEHGHVLRELGVAIFLLGIKQYKHGYDPVVYETSL